MSERLSAGLLGIVVLGAVGCSQPPRPSAPQAPPTPPAQIAPWGLDLAARDSSVKPGDDFYGYADGHWLDTHQIPSDRTRWGSFDELGERSHDQVRSIVEALPDGAPAGSNGQKVGDYYRSYLDTEAIERLGLTPAQAALDAIGDARTHKQLARLMGRADLALKAPLRVGINLDQKDPDRYAVTITQSGLGMPDRDYYLKGDTVYANLRTQYLAHITRLLALAGDHDAAREAHAVLEIETRIAKLHWPAAKRRERDLTWNPRTLAELDQLAPRFSWNLLLSSEGVDAQAQFVVRELNAVQDLAQLFLKIPVDDWRAYFRYHYLADHAEVLPKAFDEERFDFYERTLRGQQAQKDRWKRAVDALDEDLGEAVGELYVQRYFPPASRQQVLALVENLRASYAAHIEQLPWMTPETRQVALEKLAAFHPKIGYPERWRDYSGLSIVRGDALRKRVDRLAAQYDEFVVLPGLNVNGRLTLGENIGDLGGLSVAYDAYHRSLNGAAPPVLDGLTGDQRFFLSYAQIWRSLYREQQLRSQVLSNPHSPPKFRVNGVVRNVDAWYSAFAVQPGDKLYLPADARVRIW